MAIHKHKLTSGTDHLKGGPGTDLFLAPSAKVHGHLVATLTNTDVLDGGKGIDTIQAALHGKSLAPELLHLENAVFSHAAKTSFKLDLAKAVDLQSLTLDQFHSDAKVVHADWLDTLTVSNAKSTNMLLSGTDTNAITAMNLNFANLKDVDLRLAHSGPIFAELDVTLSSSHVYLTGAPDADWVKIHSNGKHHNTFVMEPDSASPMINTVTITGKADLDMLDGDPGALHAIANVFGSTFKGDLTGSFGGAALSRVLTGSGDDWVAITEINNSSKFDAKVDLGAGRDFLSLIQIVIDFQGAEFLGGTGIDTLRVRGNASNWQSPVSEFENLQLMTATGTYALNSAWQRVTFLDQVPGVNNVVLQGGTALVAVTATASSDGFFLDDLGGSAAAKAQVSMRGGDDFLGLNNLDLDATTQHFFGGAGFDEVLIKGGLSGLDLFDGFEQLGIIAGAGTYNLHASDFTNVRFAGATAGSVFITNMVSGGTLLLGSDVSNLVSISVANGVNSKSESLSIEFVGSTQIGTQSTGVYLDNLSELTISSASGSPATAYLSSLGSSTDYATLNLSGAKFVTVKASTGADLFIDHVVITNSAGVDLSSIAKGASDFALTGATIEGGSGNDTLIGGDGADTISTGAGVNKVYGSLGIDTFNFLSASGSNAIAYTAQGQSTFNAGDIVNNFNLFDTINVGALVGAGSFGGNVSTFSEGLATLDTSAVVAFFQDSTDTLYIDLNHDGALTAGSDMELHLNGVSSLNSFSLIF